MAESTQTRAPAGTNRKTLESMLAAFGRGDMQELVTYFSPDVVLQRPPSLPFGGEHHGIDAFVETITKLGARYVIDVARYDIVDAGEIELCMIDVRFTSRSTGRSAHVPNVEVYRFTDGLISDIDVYYKDTQALLEILPAGRD